MGERALRFRGDLACHDAGKGPFAGGLAGIVRGSNEILVRQFDTWKKVSMSTERTGA
jgi:hypothetical protein